MCYGVIPVTQDLVVFEERERRATRAPDPRVSALTSKLTRPQVEATLKKLTTFHTRHSTSDDFARAAAFGGEQLVAMGYATSTQNVAVGSKRTTNMIADKAGSGSPPRKVVIVTAHLDSINADGGSPRPRREPTTTPVAALACSRSRAHSGNTLAGMISGSFFSAERNKVSSAACTTWRAFQPRNGHGSAPPSTWT